MQLIYFYFRKLHMSVAIGFTSCWNYDIIDANTIRTSLLSVSLIKLKYAFKTTLIPYYITSLAFSLRDIFSMAHAAWNLTGVGWPSSMFFSIESTS